MLSTSLSTEVEKMSARLSLVESRVKVIEHRVSLDPQHPIGENISTNDIESHVQPARPMSSTSFSTYGPTSVGENTMFVQQHGSMSQMEDSWKIPNRSPRTWNNYNDLTYVSTSDTYNNHKGAPDNNAHTTNLQDDGSSLQRLITALGLQQCGDTEPNHIYQTSSDLVNQFPEINVGTNIPVAGDGGGSRMVGRRAFPGLSGSPLYPSRQAVVSSASDNNNTSENLIVAPKSSYPPLPQAVVNIRSSSLVVPSQQSASYNSWGTQCNVNYSQDTPNPIRRAVGLIPVVATDSPMKQTPAFGGRAADRHENGPDNVSDMRPIDHHHQYAQVTSTSVNERMSSVDGHYRSIEALLKKYEPTNASSESTLRNGSL